MKKDADVSGLDGHKAGEVYELRMIDKNGDIWLRTDNEYISWCYHPDDAEEVFEPTFNHQKPFTADPKPLHKDTDLGYFAIEIMKSIIKIAPLQKPNPEATNELFCKDCISLAKELIKQLNEETK